MKRIDNLCQSNAFPGLVEVRPPRKPILLLIPRPCILRGIRWHAQPFLFGCILKVKVNDVCSFCVLELTELPVVWDDGLIAFPNSFKSAAIKIQLDDIICGQSYLANSRVYHPLDNDRSRKCYVNTIHTPVSVSV